jgi:hypothetical protein
MVSSADIGGPLWIAGATLGRGAARGKADATLKRGASGLIDAERGPGQHGPADEEG